MKVRMTGLILVTLFCLAFSPVCSAQDQGYFAQMGESFTRGLKNLVSFPFEIPATIGKHDQTDNGNPRLLRDAAGLADGTFRSLTRLCSGVWDVLFSVVPGSQNELTLDPPTLF